LAQSKKFNPAPKPKAKSGSPTPPIFSSWLKNGHAFDQNSDLHRKIFIGLSGLILAFTVFLSAGSGINGDDKMQNEYEQKLMTWYGTMGQDTAALNLPKTKMHFYGGVFEVLSGVSNKILGQDNPDMKGYHTIRHFWSAIFGVTAMVFSGLLAMELGGWLAGIFALVLIFLTPSFTGHSLMNPKDIPFATGYIMSLYFTLKLLRSLPKPKMKILIGLGVGLGISLGVRAGGLINFAILGMFMGIHFVASYGFGGIFTQGKQVLIYTKNLLIPAAIGYLFAIIFWPYALQAPLTNVLKSLSELTDYGVNIRLLFDGTMVFAQTLPWNYLPMWVIVTVPIAVLIGWVLVVVFGKSIWHNHQPIGLFLLAFGFLFPFLYVMYKGSTVYDGWRHMLFPYTAGTAMAGIGFNTLVQKFHDKKYINMACIALPFVLLLNPMIFMIQNSKYPYVYFNQLVGGTKGAFGKWEMDYWGVSVKQGVDWLEKEGILSANNEDTITIATNFFYQLEKYVKPKYGDKVKLVYVRYRQRYDQNWDYGLFVNRFIDASYLEKGSFPPKGTLHTVKADGVALLAIMQNKSKFTSLGMAATKKQDWAGSIDYFTKALQEDPRNDVALAGIANAYLATSQFELAKKNIDICIDVDPDNTNAWNYLGIYYLNTKKIDQAIETFQHGIKISNNNSIAYYYLASIEQQKGNLQAAIELAIKSIEANQKFPPGFQMLASLYQAAGEPEKAAQVMSMMPK